MWGVLEVGGAGGGWSYLSLLAQGLEPLLQAAALPLPPLHLQGCRRPLPAQLLHLCVCGGVVLTTPPKRGPHPLFPWPRPPLAWPRLC